MQFVGKIHDLVGVARPATDLLPHATKVIPSVTQVATAALRRFNRIAAPRTTINPQPSLMTPASSGLWGAWPTSSDGSQPRLLTFGRRRAASTSSALKPVAFMNSVTEGS